MVKVFFDTEFTKLSLPFGAHNAKLISIGCVAESGEEFYAELTDTYQLTDCSDFVMEIVLPLLSDQSNVSGSGFLSGLNIPSEKCRMTERQCALALKHFVDGISQRFSGSKVVFHTDCIDLDWPFVARLFSKYNCWPAALVERAQHTFFDDINQAGRFNQALQEYWSRTVNNLCRHHALVDARSLAYGYKQAIRVGHGL